MVRMESWFEWAAGPRHCLMVLALFFCGVLQACEEPHPDQAQKTVVGSIFIVKGLADAAATQALQQTLDKLSGVKQAKIAPQERKLWINHDPEQLTGNQLVAALKKAGYPAVLIKTTQAFQLK